MIDVELLQYGTREELINIRNKLAKRANSRIYRLKSKGKTNWAYKTVERYNNEKYGTLYFSIEKKTKVSKASIRQDIRKIADFLNSPTSTLSGRKKILNSALKTIATDKYDEYGNLVRKGYNITDKNRLIDFFESEIFKWMKDSPTITSEEALDSFTKAVNNGLADDVIYESYRKFQEGEVDNITELYESLRLDFFEDI